MSDVNDMFEHFETLAASVKDGLESAIQMVSSGIAPTREEANRLQSDMIALRVAYDEARSLAFSCVDPENDLRDGLPVLEYRDVILALEEQRLKERVAPIVDMLRKFCSVVSDSVVFEEAFRPFRGAASESLKMLESLSHEELNGLDQIESQYVSQEMFVQALECDDLASGAGLVLLDKVAKCYPQRVQQGVAMGKYRFSLRGNAEIVASDGTCTSTENDQPTEHNEANVQKMEEGRPISLAGEGNGTGLSMADAKDESSGSHLPSSKPKRTGASSFKRLLLKSANPVTGLTFAALSRFCCLSSVTLQKLARIIFVKDASLSPETATPMAVTYLLQKGIIERASTVIGNGEAYALSEDGRQLARKESVKKMMDRSGKSLWPFPYADAKGNILGCDSSAAAKEMLEQNDTLVSYLDAAVDSRSQVPSCKALQGCFWDNGHYVVRYTGTGSTVEGILAKTITAIPAGTPDAFVISVPSDEERLESDIDRIFLVSDHGIEEMAESKRAGIGGAALPEDNDSGQMIHPEENDTVEAVQADSTEDVGKSEFSSTENADKVEDALSCDVQADEGLIDDGCLGFARGGVCLDPSADEMTSKTIANNVLAGVMKLSDEAVVGLATRLMEEIATDDGGTIDFAGLETAIALLKSVCGQKGFERSSVFYGQVSLAVNSPLEREEYTGANIALAFPVYDEGNKGFALAAYCLAMLAPKHGYDYVLHEACESHLNSFAELFPSFSIVKSLFGELFRVWDMLPKSGFSPSVLAGIGNDTERREVISDIQDKAKMLLEPPMFKAAMSRLPAFSQVCFGNGSDLYSCMEIIANNSEEESSRVEHILNAYCASGEFDDGLIDELIDDAWGEAMSVRGSSGPRKLGMDSRRKAFEAISDRLELMKQWLEYGKASINRESTENIRGTRDKLIALSDEITSSCSLVGQRGGGIALHVAVLEIRSWLSGDHEKVLTFKDFLRTGLLPTDEDGLPAVDASLCQVSRCEPWRAVLKHYAASKPSLIDAATNIGDDNSPTFDNLGQLSAISKRIGGEEIGSLDEDARAIAFQAAEAEFSKFNDQLEIAFTYNRIDEVQKENLASFARDFKGSFYSLDEYGCWREFLRGLLEQIDDFSEAHSLLLEERLSSCRGSVVGGKSALLDEAERLLLEDKNLTVVEEYLNRFDAGERQLAEGFNPKVSERDDFAYFISDKIYQLIFDTCRKYKEQPLASYGIDFLRKMYPESWTDRQKKSSESLVRCWPVSQKRSADTPQNIAELFRGLGLRVKDVTKPDFNGREIYRLTVRPVSCNQEAYDHPIAAFGTQMKKEIEVLVLYGNQTPQDIIKAVNDSGLSNHSFVIVNYSISLSDRRTLAELYHLRSAPMSSFLVIDQVLLLFLALNEPATRLSVMLKCTLPFTYYQPFVRDGGATADEMFCGRETELRAIIDPSGAGVVYGGRQLGKTALLQRAQSLCNKPGKGEYAVYVSILQCDTEQRLVSTLSSAMAKAGLAVDGASSITNLCNRMEEILASGSVSRILLLIDEADRYLDSISSEGYLQLQPLVDLRRETSNAFKFVLAGLHNVSRAKNATANNGIFGQLGAPLCIRPLSPAEALRLISRPLMFLGFQVDRYPHLETILTSTNYYPGILQFFGNILVETMASQYSTYYRAQDECPPYPLTKDQLGAIMSRTDLNSSIKEKFRLSLELDPRYFMIARCIALLYFGAEESGGESTLEGYSPGKIKYTADEWGIKMLANESELSYGNLMDEMVDMYILIKPDPDVQRYRLRRHAFLSIIGKNADVVLNDIVNNDAQEG